MSSPWRSASSRGFTFAVCTHSSRRTHVEPDKDLTEAVFLGHSHCPSVRFFFRTLIFHNLCCVGVTPAGISGSRLPIRCEWSA
jgi:hypothetical protein